MIMFFYHFYFLYLYDYLDCSDNQDIDSKNLSLSISPIQNHSLKVLEIDLYRSKSLNLEKLVSFFVGFSMLQELCLVNANLKEKDAPLMNRGLSQLNKLKLLNLSGNFEINSPFINHALPEAIYSCLKTLYL